MNGACRGASVTCKCPWYILSTQSVADLSVCGCLDLFRTCGADCRTRSRGHGAELAELSSSRVLKPTLSPGFLCAETARRAGPHFHPSATKRLHGMRRSVVHHNIAAFKVVIVFADVRDPPSLPPLLSLRLSFLLSAPLHLLLHLFFLAGVVSVWTLLGLQSLLITDSSFLFCQQLPVTQPSGASSSADVLHKEAHKNICLPAQGI